MASASSASYNKKSSAVKRILSEARELEADASSEYCASPLEDNIFEWHFTLRGAPGSEFEQGIYHGRILLPPEYPFRPPSLMLLTPNGRWECGKKICLTFTGFHEEQWQPAWGIRTALLGVQAFMTARREAAQGVGALDVSPAERERMARSSVSWTCAACGGRRNDEILPPPPPGEARGQAEQLPHGLEVAHAAAPSAEDVPPGDSQVAQPGDSLAQTTAPGTAALLADAPQASAAPVESPAAPAAPLATVADPASSAATAVEATSAPPPPVQVPPRVPVAAAPSEAAESSVRAAPSPEEAADSSATAISAPPEAPPVRSPETREPQARSAPSWVPAHAPPPPPTSAAPAAPAAPRVSAPSSSTPTLRPARPPLGPRISTGTLIRRPAAAAAATHAAQAAARPRAEQRVAQLDRAIATVVLLLACMLVRRWLQ